MDIIFQYITLYMMILSYLLSAFKNTAGGAALDFLYPKKKKCGCLTHWQLYIEFNCWKLLVDSEFHLF